MTDAVFRFTFSTLRSFDAAFTKSAVIFEDAYENLPGQWVGKRSTRTRLNLVAHGGPNGAADDISVTATLTENVTGSTSSDSCAATSVRLELVAEETPPSSAGINVCMNGRDFFCPWVGGVLSPTITCGDVSYQTSIEVVEPRIICNEAEWNSAVTGAQGTAGRVAMKLHLYVVPATASFFGIYMQEIPDNIERPHFGYFDDVLKGGPLSHTSSAGAGNWEPVRRGGYWTTDHVQAGLYPPPWSIGWKEWLIPIGWGQIGIFKGVISPNPTTQRFDISDTGTVSVRKYQHEIRRTVTGAVWLDGVKQN